MNKLDLPEPSTLKEFDNHKLITFNYEKDIGLCGFIAIHRLNKKHPSFGATRFWNYTTEKEALMDALRLSKAMSYKAALAGLPGGGAKAVLVKNSLSENNKEKVFIEYARRVNYLSGKFVTGSDVGLKKEDVVKMRKISPYFVGTKVSPEVFTALGIFYSIKVCLKYIYGSDDMAKKSFAIQGVGKVGGNLLRLLYKETHNIFISDIDGDKIKLVKNKFPEIKIVQPGNIHKKRVDIFSPCALSGCINYRNIHEFNCKIILGGANNQLEDRNLSEVIHKMGILYAPDYVVNAGGLISVYDEYGNKRTSIKRIKNKVAIISETLNKIIRNSIKENKSSSDIADYMAEKIFNNHS